MKTIQCTIFCLYVIIIGREVNNWGNKTTISPRMCRFVTRLRLELSWVFWSNNLVGLVVYVHAHMSRPLFIWKPGPANLLQAIILDYFTCNSFSCSYRRLNFLVYHKINEVNENRAHLDLFSLLINRLHLGGTFYS